VSALSATGLLAGLPSPPEPPVPGFGEVAQGLILLLLPAATGLLVAVNLVMAVQSWVSGGRQVVQGARLARGAAVVVLRTAAAQRLNAVAVTSAVLVAQAGVLFLTYVGGCVLTATSDAARTAAITAAVRAGGWTMVVHPWRLLLAVLDTGWLSLLYPVIAVAVLGHSYRLARAAPARSWHRRADPNALGDLLALPAWIAVLGLGLSVGLQALIWLFTAAVSLLGAFGGVAWDGGAFLRDVIRISGPSTAALLAAWFFVLLCRTATRGSRTLVEAWRPAPPESA
jgi:hypothetical protein